MKALSRDIKFRAFYKEENCMFYSCEVLEWVIWEFSCGEIKVVVQELGTEEKEWNVKDLSVMQFTGLYDKNGKEIYEGDILFGDIMPHKHSVEYIGSGFKVFGRDLNWKPDHNSKPLNEILEIIGNIYENPELLN